MSRWVVGWAKVAVQYCSCSTVPPASWVKQCDHHNTVSVSRLITPSNRREVVYQLTT